MTSQVSLSLHTMLATKRLLPSPYVCTRCSRITSRNVRATRDCAVLQPLRSYNSSTATALASLRTTRKPATTLPYIQHHAYSIAVPPRTGLRIAIIGSGPAGFYTAHRLLQKVPDAVIDVYEQLPVPYGLVRFGVAPDHLKSRIARTPSKK